MKLTVASYNIHKAVGRDGRRDPERIMAVLREIDADVIALQEADRRFGARAAVLPRALIDDSPWRPAPVWRRPRSLGWHGNALLVHRDIAILKADALDLPTVEPRGAVCATLERDGVRFRVAGVHLDLSGLRRRAQIRDVLWHLGGGDPGLPSLLLGDFNQWGTRTGAMREFMRGARTAWTVLDPGRSFPSNRPFARFDRIVSSHHWQCERALVHRSALAAFASDHLPVTALLTT